MFVCVLFGEFYLQEFYQVLTVNIGEKYSYIWQVEGKKEPFSNMSEPSVVLNRV